MHGFKLVSTPPAKSAGIAISGWDKSGVMDMKAVRISLVLLAFVAPASFAQHAHGGDSGMMMSSGEPMAGMAAENAKPHIRVSPMRTATNADSARASLAARRLRSAIAKYADTSAAIADGYIFRPRFKRAPKVYHFTNR